MDTGVALLLITASALTSFVTAAVGIGGGVILLALLAVVLPPSALIPIHGIVQLGSNAGRTLLMLTQIERATLWPFTLGSLLGISLGGLLFVQLPPWLIQFAVAGFILWSIFGALPTMRSQHIFTAGAFSSFLTIFFGATGSFVSALVKSMNLSPLHHVATHSALMTLQHTLKVIAFGLLGFAFGPYALIIIGMIISGFIGTVIGRQLLLKMDKARFQSILNIVLVVLAMRLIWDAVMTLTTT